MTNKKGILKYTGNSGIKTPEEKYQEYQKKYKKEIIIAIVFIIISLILISWLYYCMLPGVRLKSFYFTIDSEAQLDDALLDELYYKLDSDSRMNVTNETYFLVLSIPDLDYSVRFDYLFEFNNSNSISLKIANHDEIVKGSDKGKGRWINLSIEFHIDSLDPDISQATIFPHDNVIDGHLHTFGVDSGTFHVDLDEGDVIRSDWEHEILKLPYNQTIIGVAEFEGDPLCPFK
ncbi:MAG: hypothetical protein JSW00_00920 [Thermoplasmata archaeon]|nr:MAG: hypothetical protein JSW00_00920 [Thermoplasmata archaeon]